MSTEAAASAAIALNRFGLGAWRDEAAPSAPKRWLIDQFAAFEPRPAALTRVPTSAAMATQFHDYLLRIRELQGGNARGTPEATIPPIALAPGMAAPPPLAKSAQMDLRQVLRRGYRASYIALVTGRVAAAVASPTPFPERLVHFWANHFAVSADKLQTIGLAGTLEFEAIRPNLSGTFADLLLAVERHPAMLLYLDQAQSIGPNSLVGSRAALRVNARRKVGLNENLAREIMELHTLGVGAGYTQADVQELARGLTGWSVGGFVRRPIGIEAPDGASVFQPGWHEPGARILLGVRYAAGGVEQGEAMLRALSVHPATARHLATKLARHFVADVPSPALVTRLAAVHVATGGDLMAVYRALVDAPEAWATPLPKFKTPWDWTVSALRGVGGPALPADGYDRIAGALVALGQPVWRPGSPAGWDDIAATWAAPDALLRRVELAQRIAMRAGGALDARALGPRLMPGVWSTPTAEAVAKADSTAQGLAMLLVAPEFLRR